MADPMRGTRGTIPLGLGRRRGLTDVDEEMGRERDGSSRVLTRDEEDGTREGDGGVSSLKRGRE